MVAETPALSPTEAGRLIEFARACKAAARAVSLYPDGHPAVGATLGRIAALTASERLPAPLCLSVLPADLLIEGHAVSKPDPAIRELAALLHEQLIGELTIDAGGDPAAWGKFLRLLARPSDDVRAEGGISRLWTASGGNHITIKEIDYGYVLRERDGGVPAGYEEVIAKCLDGDRAELSDDLTDRLVGAAAEVPVLAALLKAIEEKGRGYDAGRPSDGVMELLRHILDAVATTVPANLESALRNLAKAITEMSPETVANLLSTRASGRAFDNGAQTLDAIVSQMSDEAIAGFVARHANADDSSLARVAQAFGTLVRDDEHGERLLTLAHDQAAHMPFGSEPQFGERWDQVAQRMLTSYSDRPFVSDAYARELMATRTQAIQVDQISDDPPERLKAWLDTVATSELRRLDLLLVNDLLRIESDSDRWAALMPPAVSLIEDLLLVGDLDAAEELLHAITGEAGTSGAPERAAAARRALDALTSGPIVRHMTRFLAEATAEQFDRVRAFCTAFGHALVHPVGEALMTEERPAARERLATILIGFGPAARREAHRLVTSPSATIRRIGVQILREAAGEESLGELRPLLSDPEPQIQRDVVRAILKVGTTAAFEMLQTALANPASSSHEAVMKAVNAHDERTVALFVHILDHVDHRGPLAATYASALDALGVLKNPAGVPSLKSALYRGEWWAPRRTRALREAAADALARIGTPDALAVLDEAGSSGPRGVRAAVRASAQRRPARGPR